jgi:hypothetical protein
MGFRPAAAFPEPKEARLPPTPESVVLPKKSGHNNNDFLLIILDTTSDANNVLIGLCQRNLVKIREASVCWSLVYDLRKIILFDKITASTN